MKKSVITFFAFALMASFNVNAQEQGLWSTNVSFNPFGSGSSNVFGLEKLQVRRFLNDNSALRLSLGFKMNNAKLTQTVDNEDPNIDKNKSYTISHGTNEAINRSKTFQIGVGYEYHKVIDKIDLYAGGELGYEGKFYSATRKSDSDSESQSVSGSSVSKNESSRSSSINYYNCAPTSITSAPTPTTSALTGVNNNSHGFYVKGLAGVDVYVYKNIYIGGELGIFYNIDFAKDGYYESESENTSKTVSGATTTSSTTTTEFSSKTGEGVSTTTGSDPVKSYSAIPVGKQINHTIGLFIEPTFHLGIRF